MDMRRFYNRKRNKLQGKKTKKNTKIGRKIKDNVARRPNERLEEKKNRRKR